MRAASSMIWFMAGAMKSANWISAMGRIPLAAAPMASPTMVDSASGVSITRSAPYFLNRPSVARNTPPRWPTSSPMMKTDWSRAISSSIPSRMASITVLTAISAELPGEHVGQQVVGCGVGRLFRVLSGIVHLGGHPLGDGGFDGVGEDARLAQVALVAGDRIL